MGDELVEFVGEIGETDKEEFLGNARALLFPIDWPEPFGLVMIEAMSCGTPVIAWKEGSVPEIIDPDVTGHVVTSIDEAIAAARDVGKMDRAAVRKRYEERFGVEHMARNYVQIYADMLNRIPIRKTA